MKKSNYSLVNQSETIYPPTYTRYHYPNHYNRYSSYEPSPIHYIQKRSPGTFGDLLRSMMPFRQPKSIRQGRHLKPNTQSSGNLPSSSNQNNPTKSGCYSGEMLHLDACCMFLFELYSYLFNNA